MAHKKAGGSSRNGRDSEGRRLGVKKFGGEAVVWRQHHRAPARHQMASRRECRNRDRSHVICLDRRKGRFPHQGRWTLLYFRPAIAASSDNGIGVEAENLHLLPRTRWTWFFERENRS